MNDTQFFIDPQNKIFRNILHLKVPLLVTVTIIILTIPLLGNYLNGKPLLMAGESYYHLLQTSEHWYYAPLSVAYSLLGLQGLSFIPLILSVATIILFFPLAKKIHLSEQITFFL
ncbi:MAG: hypothetical protein AABX37_05415, partial [Nanoarchaeota archaeon]